MGGLGESCTRDYMDLLGSGVSAAPCELLAFSLLHCGRFGPRSTSGAVYGCRVGKWGVRWLGRTLGF